MEEPDNTKEKRAQGEFLATETLFYRPRRNFESQPKIGARRLRCARFPTRVSGTVQPHRARISPLAPPGSLILPPPRFLPP